MGHVINASILAEHEAADGVNKDMSLVELIDEGFQDLRMLVEGTRVQTSGVASRDFTSKRTRNCFPNFALKKAEK